MEVETKEVKDTMSGLDESPLKKIPVAPQESKKVKGLKKLFHGVRSAIAAAKREQKVLSVFYILFSAITVWMAVASKEPKVSIAWLFAAIVVSQVTTDLADFSDSKNKGYFSATLRTLTVLIALTVAYVS
ncbi:hypothetical protein [Lelliottia amnigena]